MSWPFPLLYPSEASYPGQTSPVERLYQAFEPYQHAEPENGYALAWLCLLVGHPHHAADLVARDFDDGVTGWDLLYNPDTTPEWALPWLAQHAGLDLPAGLDEHAARARIKDRPQRRRGTPGAIIAAAKEHLTGPRLATLYQRQGSQWDLLLITYAGQTPDPAAVAAAASAPDVKAAGFRLIHRVDPGWSYGQAQAAYGTYAAAQAAYSTYGAAQAQLPTP